MKYKEQCIVSDVACYKVKGDVLISSRGKDLWKYELFYNDVDTGICGVTDIFYLNGKILFNQWGSENSFLYDIMTKKESIAVYNQYVTAQRGEDLLIYKDSNGRYHYLDKEFNEVLISAYLFKVLEANYGITIQESKILCISLQGEQLWAFSLSSLGDVPYVPEEHDRIDRILGIVDSYFWFYTKCGRLVALDVESGNPVKVISCQEIDVARGYDICIGLGDVYLHENNIYGMSHDLLTHVDARACRVVEQYNILEADPDGVGQFRYRYSPLLQGDYFTFIGIKSRERYGCGWVGIFDYKARKLVWECEIIDQKGRDTGNHLVPPRPLHMANDRLYIKDLKDNLYIFEREE